MGRSRRACTVTCRSIERRCVAGASCALRSRRCHRLDHRVEAIPSGASAISDDRPLACPVSLAWPRYSYREILRRFGPHRPLAGLHSYRRTRLHADLSAVLDCRDLAALGLTEDALLDDLNYDIGHALGLAALRRGAEGILVPSATRAGDNLIVLPDNLRPTARIEPTTDILELTHFVIP